jgi:ABC-type sugar transport system ATPase subunit
VPRQATNDGIACITEDRKANRVFETMVVDDNVYLGKLATKGGFSYLLSRARRSKLASYWVERLKISALAAESKDRRAVQRQSAEGRAGEDAGAGSVDNHLRRTDAGVDVGTIPDIPAEIRRLADEGKGVVVISSYLPKVLAVSDRSLVARTGRMVAEFDAAEATQDKIFYAAMH